MILLVDDLELAPTITLDPTLDPSKPGVQLFKEGPRSCPVQHDHDDGMRMSMSRLQEIRHEGGV